jgi:hypothetical protein
MHNVVGQLHIDAIYHIEDKNRFDHRKDKTAAEENQKRKHVVGVSKGRQQGCPICFTLFRPGVFPGAIKVVGIFATAFRKCHLILIIVELGTTTLVHVLQDGDRVARLLIELEIPKAFFSRQIGFISIEHDDAKVDEPE